jgi:hypothetical protein
LVIIAGSFLAYGELSTPQQHEVQVHVRHVVHPPGASSDAAPSAEAASALALRCSMTMSVESCMVGS